MAAMQPDDSQRADLNQIVTVENCDRSPPKTGVLVDLVSRLAFVLVDDRRLFRLGFGGGGVDLVVWRWLCGGGCGGRGSLLTRIRISSHQNPNPS
ncbi:hypothetical protein QYF36_002982 [Acer negundo]|nr:hypothetical protein QYF36_002982 [Acer negundo]